MKDKKDIIDKTFKMVWAYMPLSTEEMRKIGFRHQVRPYLLCMEKKDFFYAFPSTSQVSTSKIRYQNEKVILDGAVDDKKSLVDLSRVYKLPKENIRSDEYIIFDYQANEIIKKMQACFEYCDYPEEVKEYFSHKKVSYSDNDLVESNGMLYNIVGYKGKNILFTLPVFKYPVDNTVLVETDGLKYYVDVQNIVCIKREDVDKYCTQLFGFTRGNSMKNRTDLKELLEYYSTMPTIACNKDFTKFCNLEPGMIINYEANDVSNKMIILENYGSDLEVIVGLDGEMYRDFIPMNLPSNIDFQYEIAGTLNEERLANLIDRSKDKLNEMVYVKKLFS